MKHDFHKKSGPAGPLFRVPIYIFDALGFKSRP